MYCTYLNTDGREKETSADLNLQAHICCLWSSQEKTIPLRAAQTTNWRILPGIVSRGHSVNDTPLRAEVLKQFDVKTFAPSDVKVAGIPKVEINSRITLRTFSVLSAASLKTVSQLE